jgi:hypothetical protein
VLSKDGFWGSSCIYHHNENIAQLNLVDAAILFRPRSIQHTIAVFSVFASKEDMEYYDNDCEAHKALKMVAKEVHQGIMMVYFESIFD